MPPVINDVSAAACRIEACDGHGAFAVGSGMFYEFEEQTYLVSNWHVLSGRDTRTHQPTDRNARVPSFARVTTHGHIEGSTALQRLRFEVPLLDKSGSALFFFHPSHGSKVDVACIGVNGVPVISMNRLPMDDLSISVTDEVFVVGYPYGLPATADFPVWKRATVASEPDLPHVNGDFESDLFFLVDTATREGMSGSPALGRFFKFVPEPTRMRMTRSRKLIGIYSGRFTGKPQEAELGLIWKIATVDQILAARVKSTLSL